MAAARSKKPSNPVEEARALWRNLAQKFDARLCVLECTLDPAVHKERVEKRVRGLFGLPEVTWQRIEAVQEEYTQWQEEHLRLDTQAPIHELLDKAVGYIQSRAG